ncbi:MAG: hypothetical protein H6536_04315 [Bacteroidales bacterium]|nr:hypothetical protein [Bacteroidales bacterium]
MKTDFLCPKCLGYLSVGSHVVFNVKNKDHEGGLILFSPVLGDYAYIANPSFKITPGESLEYRCPICHAPLSVKGADNLVEVIMVEDDNSQHRVVFSTKEGEKCTYKISDKGVEKYGQHADSYMDFITASFMK